MCGRVALGLSGATVVAGAMGAGRVALAGYQAVRGVSQMIARESDMSDQHPQRDDCPAARNGHALPMDWQGVPDDVIQRMELAYQEIQRRDSQAEQRAWRKDKLVQRLGLVIVVLAGVLVWMVADEAPGQSLCPDRPGDGGRARWCSWACRRTSTTTPRRMASTWRWWRSGCAGRAGAATMSA